MNIFERFEKNGYIKMPRWMGNNFCYIALTGSQSYGTNNPDSDFDIYGVYIPLKEDAFPHLKGEIVGFGRKQKPQDTYEFCKDGNKIFMDKKEYDAKCASIIKYFSLVLENNPNCVDILFVPENCILHCNKIGRIMRDNRKMFLHKGCFHKFRGYAMSQLKKMETKEPEGKRKELRDKYGLDVKFGMNVVRILYECEMILSEGDLDLQRHNEVLKFILKGEWSLEKIKSWAAEKDKKLEELYSTSTIPMYPDEEKIKVILLSCLEEHYGNLSNCVNLQNKEALAVKEISDILKKYNIQ